MRYQRQNFEEKVDHSKDFSNMRESHPIEKLFYEVRPLLFMALALFALKHNVDSSIFIKAFSFGLLGISAFILYSRMIARGYLK